MWRGKRRRRDKREVEEINSSTSTATRTLCGFFFVRMRVKCHTHKHNRQHTLFRQLQPASGFFGFLLACPSTCPMCYFQTVLRSALCQVLSQTNQITDGATHALVSSSSLCIARFDVDPEATRTCACMCVYVCACVCVCVCVCMLRVCDVVPCGAKGKSSFAGWRTRWRQRKTQEFVHSPIQPTLTSNTDKACLSLQTSSSSLLLLPFFAPPPSAAPSTSSFFLFLQRPPSCPLPFFSS